MRLLPLPKAQHVGAWSAQYIADKINAFRPSEKRPFLLGLPTGSTPLPTYQTLIKMHQAGEVSFQHVVTFNMDEYIGLPYGHPESYRSFMYKNFFDHIDIKQKNINLLNGNVKDYGAECQRYENKIKAYGSIHLFMGGLGGDGHIAFNEPGSSLNSRTRIKTLTPDTRVANSRFFDNDITKVPHYALTIGVGTLMESEEILILATGSTKAQAVQAVVEGAVTHLWPASAIQMHCKAILVCDEEATIELKVKTLQYFKGLEKNIIIKYQ
ncbi:glucosamine-6-phosphate deaminase [Bartonella sp. DGB2]|uniref:glucosamine-6-phosphate deaminase n=1 Tax=Bartonella sp. DGB2 TaxID=3388426 RepID=UPI00398FF825